MAKASVVICSWNRPQDLEDCLNALTQQTEQDFETILIQERGDLAALRNQGWRRAVAPVVVFLDDDAVPAPTWLSGVLQELEKPGRVGVSGMAIIPRQFRQNRDLLSSRFWKLVHDWLFVGSIGDKPGHLTPAGSFTTASAEETCTYEGPVDYLEPCHMAFKKEALEAVNGFDETYAGVGDWSEPDLCLRLKRVYGHACLWFSQSIRIEHRPSPSGATTLRRRKDVSQQRLLNYERFSQRWVQPSVRHALYKAFLRTYYWIKAWGN